MTVLSPSYNNVVSFSFRILWLLLCLQRPGLSSCFSISMDSNNNEPRLSTSSSANQQFPSSKSIVSIRNNASFPIKLEPKTTSYLEHEVEKVNANSLIKDSGDRRRRRRNSIVQIAGHNDHAGIMIGRSSIKPSKPYRNHKQQWMGETGCDWPTECCVEGCMNIASIGARIFRNGSTSCWIAPMCYSCSGRPDNHVEMIQRSNMAENSSFQHPLKLKAGTICLEVESINICSQLDKESRRRWKENFNLLLAYKNEFQHCGVPQKYLTPAGIQLGEWVNNQRKIKRLKPFMDKDGKVKVSMDKEVQRRIRQLNDIGFVWDATFKNEEWEENFELLLSYKKEFQHLHIPMKYVTPNGIRLGNWIAKQRQRLKPFIDKEGKVKVGTDNIIQERIECLNAIGFVWEIGRGRG